MPILWARINPSFSRYAMNVSPSRFLPWSDTSHLWLEPRIADRKYDISPNVVESQPLIIAIEAR